jgi:APA family basic amino acid/polyamine antiporter
VLLLHCSFCKLCRHLLPVLDQTLFTVGTSFFFVPKVLAIFSIILLTYINTKGVERKTVQLIFTSAKLIAHFCIDCFGIYVGLQTDVLSNNFANMWEASKTIVNPDGTVTVTKLAGMAILGAAGATIINSLFSSDAWNNVTLLRN